MENFYLNLSKRRARQLGQRANEFMQIAYTALSKKYNVILEPEKNMGNGNDEKTYVFNKLINDFLEIKDEDNICISGIQCNHGYITARGQLYDANMPYFIYVAVRSGYTECKRVKIQIFPELCDTSEKIITRNAEKIKKEIEILNKKYGNLRIEFTYSFPENCKNIFLG